MAAVSYTHLDVYKRQGEGMEMVGRGEAAAIEAVLEGKARGFQQIVQAAGSPGKPLEGTDKAAAGRNSLSLPLLRGPSVNIVSVAPHFGEQSDIRPHLLRFPTGTDSLFQILFQAAAGRYLQ